MTRKYCSHNLSFSIHVPREGDDFGMPTNYVQSELFLSTSPARGTTILDLDGILDVTFLSTSPARGTTMVCYEEP